MSEKGNTTRRQSEERRRIRRAALGKKMAKQMVSRKKPANRRPTSGRVRGIMGEERLAGRGDVGRCKRDQTKKRS